MSQKLDYEKARLAQARKTNIVDEREWRKNDRAAKWLAKVEPAKKPGKRRR